MVFSPEDAAATSATPTSGSTSRTDAEVTNALKKSGVAAANVR